MNKLYDFYKGKRVFVTGHTGFKGSWLCSMLLSMGADVYGYSHQLYPLFQTADIQSKTHTVIGDIRDFEKLESAVKNAQPELIFHLAAQPLVIESYRNPRETYAVNVLGTVNILEAARSCRQLRALVNVTTDKVYKNNEWHWGYRETDTLNGYDPYSNSKSCSELVTDSYRNSFFADNSIVGIATARAGNVIGGGDFSANRIIPDCIRAAHDCKPIIVRNKSSIRPWQHVMEPLFGYLTLGRALHLKQTTDTAFNFGPNDDDCVNVADLAELFCNIWGENMTWEYCPDSNALHEATFLKLDCSKAHNMLNWWPQLNIKQAIEFSIDWQKQYDSGVHALEIMQGQIKKYFLAIQ